MKLINEPTALAGRLSLSVGWENSPEWPLTIVSFNPFPVIYAKSAAPDQTPSSVEFDLGLYCLPMSEMS